MDPFCVCTDMCVYTIFGLYHQLTLIISGIFSKKVNNDWFNQTVVSFEEQQLVLINWQIFMESILNQDINWWTNDLIGPNVCSSQ